MDRQPQSKQNKPPVRALWKWLLFSAVVIYCVITMISQQTEINEQKKTLESLAGIEEELQGQIENLQNEVDYMGTDEYIERVARNKLGMIKKEETVFKEEAGE